MGKYYKGNSFGSFDGTIKAEDMTGPVPLIKLVLTAGGAEIECVCCESDKEYIIPALDHRARVYGVATYDGIQGLPVRIDVRKIELVPECGDFMQWRGAFEPFDLESDWMDE